MPQRVFYGLLSVCLAVFLAVNAAVHVLCRNTIPRQIARRIDRAPVLNYLALGNSLMQAGFDEAAFERARAAAGTPAKAVNAGLGSSSPVEHLIFLRRAFQTRRNVDCVFYGFYDFQLTTLPATAQSDLIGNRAMLYYFEPSIVPAYFDWSLPETLRFHALRLFPALAERGVIWEKVEVLRRRMAAAGMPAEQNNRFGRVRDFQLLESDDQPGFARECELQIARRKPLANPILDMIRLARARGSQFAMIEMPMHAWHQKRYYRTPAWDRYRTYMKTLLENEGASYVQAGGWIEDERMFADHLHVSGPGSEVFSRMLASVCESDSKGCGADRLLTRRAHSDR